MQKYLFHIHSNITDLVAKQVIQHLQLNVDDCIFILSRNQKTNFKHSISIPFQFQPKEYFTVSLAFWNNWTKLKVFDAWIEELTKGHPFSFFVPHTDSNFAHVLINHPRCTDFAYLEEGTLSYSFEKQVLRKKPFWPRDVFYQLNFKNRSLSVKAFYDFKHPKYKAAYGVGDIAFKAVPNRVIIPIEDVEVHQSVVYSTTIVFSHVVEAGVIPVEKYIKAYDELFLFFINENISDIHIKFHPAQEADVSLNALNALFKKYENKVNVHLLTQEVVLEYIALRGNHNFYLSSSSVGIYACMQASNKVHTLANKMIKLEPSAQKFFDTLPDFYKNKLIYL